MSIIIKPIVTEKMTELGEKLNRVAFYVDKKANKIEIKKAIEELYGVKVDSVNTMEARRARGMSPDLNMQVATEAWVAGIVSVGERKRKGTGYGSGGVLV